MITWTTMGIRLPDLLYKNDFIIPKSWTLKIQILKPSVVSMQAKYEKIQVKGINCS